MKDLGEANMIIRMQIIKYLHLKILKIDQKVYIQNLLESKEMSSYHLIFLLIKVSFTIFIDQVDNNFL